MRAYQYIAANGSALIVNHKSVNKGLNIKPVDKSRDNNNKNIKTNELDEEISCLGKKVGRKSL